MTTKVRFYKTKYNLKNRPYSSENIPLADYKDIVVQGVVYPDVPFIIPINLVNDIIGNNYDYLSFTYNNRIYYSFLISYQPITPTQERNGETRYGTYQFIHKTDLWLTFKNAIDSSLVGIVERAHVNDYYLKDNGVILVPTLRYTNHDAEVDYLSDDLIVSQRPLSEYSVESKGNKSYKYLYILYNKNTIPAQSYDNKIEILNNGNKFSLCLVALAIKKTDVPTIANITVKKVIDGDNEVVINKEQTKSLVSQIGSSNIVCMFYSDILIHPNCKIIGDELIYQLESYQSEEEPEKYIVDINEDKSIWGIRVDSIRLSEHIDLEFNSDYIITGKGVADVFISPDRYKTFGITKIHTSAYLPVFLIKDKSIRINTTELYWDRYVSGRYCIQLAIDPYLYSYIIMVNSRLEEEVSKISSFIITSQFLPFTQQDYWTKLNAQASIANAQFNTTKEYLKAASSIINRVTEIGKNVVGMGSANPIKAVGSGISLVGNIAGGIVDTIHSGVNIAQSHYNLNVDKENNARIINEGIKNLSQPNFSEVYTFGDEIQFVQHKWKSTNNMLRVANILHKYGYETNIPLETYFAKHSRRAFNFVKCSEVVVSGLPVEYCQELEDMFLKGVTFWKTTPMDYDVVNRQINEEEVDI